MKIRLFILFSFVFLISCYSYKTQYIIKSEKKYFWKGDKNGISYKYEVDSIVSSFIFGKLIINQEDTILTRGFEKGNLYPTWYKAIDSLVSSSNEKCLFFFRYSNYENDTLKITRTDQDSICYRIEKNIELVREEKIN